MSAPFFPPRPSDFSSTAAFIPPRPPPEEMISPPPSEARVIPPTAEARHPGAAPWDGGVWGATGASYGHPPSRGRTPFRPDGMPLQPAGMPYDHAGAWGYPPPAQAPPSARTMPRVMTDMPWLTPGGYGQPPPLSAGGMHRSRSRSRSRGYVDGFSADWQGPRHPDEEFDIRQVPVPAQFAHVVPPGTPWYMPPGVDASIYSNFQQPLPHHGAAAYVPVQPVYAAYPRSVHNTPWRGGGYLPTTPGGASDNLPDSYDRAARPDQGVGVVDTRWFSGPNYGPVLDPLLAGVVRCSFKINPLLTPPPDDPTKRPYLSWNMLFSASYTHRSDEPQRQSWMGGRDAPATNPRIASLRIISRRFPWFIDVKAREPTLGVTCGEIIDMVSHFLHERMGEKEYKSLSLADQRRVSEAYQYNRSMADDVPGGRLGQGLRKCEILGNDTMWGGLIVDQRYVTERMSIGSRPKREMTGIFVMECESRLPRTAEERRAEAQRGHEDDDDSE